MATEKKQAELQETVVSETKEKKQTKTAKKASTTKKTSASKAETKAESEKAAKTTTKKQSDAILLGPQVRFAEKDIKKMVKDTIPVMVIEVQDFGMMRADHVWSKLQTKMKG